MKVWLSLVAQIHKCNPFIQYCAGQNTDCTNHTAALWFIFPYFLSLSGLRVEQEIVTSYPQVAVVRVPTPWVQSDSDITVLRHLEKMGCRLVNRPQAILNCVNKFWTFQELAGHGVPLPDTYSYGERSSLCLKHANPQSVIDFFFFLKTYFSCFTQRCTDIDILTITDNKKKHCYKMYCRWEVRGSNYF